MHLHFMADTRINSNEKAVEDKESHLLCFGISINIYYNLFDPSMAEKQFGR